MKSFKSLRQELTEDVISSFWGGIQAYTESWGWSVVLDGQLYQVKSSGEWKFIHTADAYNKPDFKKAIHDRAQWPSVLRKAIEEIVKEQ